MAAPDVEVVGLQRLQATLKTLGKDLQELAPPDAARTIGTTARSRAPKRTGRLASSFSSQEGRGVISLSFGVPYASPIHWGVGPRSGLRGPHNIRPSLFLLGAAEDTQAQWLDDYAEAAQTACDRVKGA